ncbi:histone H1 [Pedobacter sp. GSP4]|uniref:histone H1 n=1 Tax=Pedobacter sp. GSP4 TaxID=3453716 RepID=UPI003EEFB23B
MENFQQLKKVIASLETDAKKFDDRKNRASGIRLRRAMQEIKRIAQEIRFEITERKNSAK